MEVVEQQRRVGLHGLADVEQHGQQLVFDVDQSEGFLGHVLVGGGDGGDGVTLEQHLVTGHEAGALIALALEARLVGFGHAGPRIGKVGRGHDGMNAVQRLGAGGVDG